MGAPKWQEPLVAVADDADATLFAVLRTPGGGAGALTAAASANRALAELAVQYFERSSSPLLRLLLKHGARALLAQADSLEASVIEDDSLIWADLKHDDVDQALVEPTPEPVETSDNAPANAAVVGPVQASPEGEQAVLVDEPAATVPALVAGTRVEIVAGSLEGCAGFVADPPEVEAYAGEKPGARVWIETDSGHRVTPLVADLRIIRHAREWAGLDAVGGLLAERAGQAVHERVCDCRNQGFGYTLRTHDLHAIGPAATAAVLRALRVLVDIERTPAARNEFSVWLSDLATGLERGFVALSGAS